MNLIQGAHGGRCWRNHVVHEEEERILRTEVDALPDQEVKLANGQIGGHQILLLVQIANASLRCFLHNHLEIQIHLFSIYFDSIPI